jgi:hypothetical protein
LVRRSAIAVWVFVIGVAACGGGGLTLTEYASAVEDAVAHSGARFDDIDAQLANPPSVDAARRLWDQRVVAREELLVDLRALDPPESAAELHEAALGIVSRLLEAEAALATRAATYDNLSLIGQVWNTTEGRAVRAVDEEAVAICRAAQAAFDETTSREILVEVPWITSEMKEIVDVVFQCTSAER